MPRRWAFIAAAPAVLLCLAGVGGGPPVPRTGIDAPARTAMAYRRVVTIAPNSAEIICALGACDRIVGVSKFCVYPPQLTGRPRVGGLFDPDLEKIVALHPDLIVLRGQNEAVQRLCRERGIDVYEDKTDTLADVEACILELGRLLDRNGEASKLIDDFRRKLAAIRERTAGRPRPRVLLTVSRQPDRLADILTAGKGTFLDEMLDIAGGRNVFGHLDMMYPQVSAEAIIARRPEVILELMPEVNMTPALEEKLLDQWRALGPLPAVANGRIHFLTDDHALIPSPRYVKTIEEVSRLLHPEDDGGR